MPDYPAQVGNPHADAAPCHALSTPAWSPDGSRLVFAYGPSILPRRASAQPRSFCSEPRRSRLVVVSAGRSSTSRSWKQIMNPIRCSYQSAAFDRGGIAAVEGCDTHDPPGTQRSTSLGDAYFVQLGNRARVRFRLPLPRGANPAAVAGDPAVRLVLIGEYQSTGKPSDDWVWRLDGRRLQVLARFSNRLEESLTAEPWPRHDFPHGGAQSSSSASVRDSRP